METLLTTIESFRRSELGLKYWSYDQDKIIE